MRVADTVCRTCLRCVKADGKERPAALGVVVSSPTGKNPRDRVLRTSRQEENGRHLRWLGAASSSLVSRSRACRPEAGPVLPVGAPSRPRHGAFGYTPSHLSGGTCRDGSHPGDLGSSPPRPCGPLCRPEAGVPSRPRHGAIGSTPSRAHPRCRRPVAVALHGNRWEVGVRYPTPRHGDQCPRFTRNRHPRQQVAPPWGALRAVSMRNSG